MVPMQPRNRPSAVCNVTNTPLPPGQSPDRGATRSAGSCSAAAIEARASAGSSASRSASAGPRTPSVSAAANSTATP